MFGSLPDGTPVERYTPRAPRVPDRTWKAADVLRRRRYAISVAAGASCMSIRSENVWFRQDTQAA